ncbi:uncharacterized protein C11orf52 homolog [Microcaecilia unicolor]|uniref:Uncharacterized protein C11orf52 homolog n=1 Tax=Microcaecilia unicolor TaxID=1415580 RepID=A0A6P7ZRX7_9AMPH|nr:uncharacterized protein C11orf52 homolog [Microcaecilia unicolor]
MGNCVCCKGSLKCFRRKETKGVSDQQTEVQKQELMHTYDTVADFPVYAKVNKNRKKEDNVQYADIQVFSKAPQRTVEEVRRFQKVQETEYATINFPKPHLKYDRTNGTLV